MMTKSAHLKKDSVKLRSDPPSAKPQAKRVESVSGVKIRVMATKFMNYLNQLNSSIQSCEQKSIKKRTHSRNMMAMCKRRSQSIELSNGSVSANNSENMDEHERSTGRSLDRKRSSCEYIIREGHKLDGKVHGKAVLQMANGSIFTGEVQEGQIKQGTMVFLDGVKYQGSFKNNLFHGQGILSIKNKTKYYANFLNGMMSRVGEIVYENGDIYKGEIHKYKKHGTGELKLKNGNRYVGNFEEGEITGFGTYYVNQFPTAKGEWVKGELQQKSGILSDYDIST